jgi:hypothetical protein
MAQELRVSITQAELSLSNLERIAGLLACCRGGNNQDAKHVTKCANSDGWYTV